jgi:hypothetical protein
MHAPDIVAKLNAASRPGGRGHRHWPGLAGEGF